MIYFKRKTIKIYLERIKFRNQQRSHQYLQTLLIRKIRGLKTTLFGLTIFDYKFKENGSITLVVQIKYSLNSTRLI